MKNLWREEEAANLDPIGQVIYQAGLIGAETNLVIWGGGNNSIKTEEVDFKGQTVRAMRIKGSGSDMKAMQRKDFPGVRLDDIIPLLERDTLSDEEMVAYLAQTLLDPTSPRPSIETLLHAFLPFKAIAHTHADAILALTNNSRREASVRECYGGSVAIVGYRRPGFLLSKEVALAVREQPTAQGLVLMNHGLITWGENPRAAYDRHIELVTQAEEFVEAAKKRRDRSKPGDAVRLTLPPAERRKLAAALGPALRGALSGAKRVVLRFDDSQDVLDFAGSPHGRSASQTGAATPDHMLNIKRIPLWLDPPAGPGDTAALKAVVLQQVASYQQEYSAYFNQHRINNDPMLESNPRVIILPGVGMWTAGKDARAALISADIYHHTINVIQGSQGLGEYSSLTLRDAYDAEYWPLELYKLTIAPPDRELARRVALVTGAASGIGKATALRLASEGAHVVVTDIDEAGAQSVAAEIVQQNGPGRAIALRLDVTDEASVQQAFDEICLAYGGLDILVSNAGIARVAAITDLSLADWNLSFGVNATGHFLVSRAAMRLLREQGLGGSLVFNATKNVTAPGKDFGAYSASKAAEAQLCRILAIEGGADHIRSNMVNPDAIFASGLWSDELKRQRASSYGIEVEELENFYAQRNLLKAAVRAEDVAEAIFWLASDRSAKTTGTMIPVDGGVKEAFSR